MTNAPDDFLRTNTVAIKDKATIKGKSIKMENSGTVGVGVGFGVGEVEVETEPSPKFIVCVLLHSLFSP